MASRKGRVRPPRDASFGGSGTGGRALASDTFLTGQSASRERFSPASTGQSERRPRQVRISMSDMANFIGANLASVPVGVRGTVGIRLLSSAAFNGTTTDFADIIPLKADLVQNEILLIHSGVGVLKRVASAPAAGQFSLYGINNRSIKFGYAPEAGDYVYVVFVIG